MNGIGPPREGALHALIVEDLAIWQGILSEVLTGAGYQVCITSSYAEALEALARQEFHLAVIDPVLDDANRRNRDGLHVLQHILDRKLAIGAVVVTSSEPQRIGREVAEMSPAIPLLWKDEWDDEYFLSIIGNLVSVKRET